VKRSDCHAKRYGHLLRTLRLLEDRPIHANAMRRIRAVIGNVPLDAGDMPAAVALVKQELEVLRITAPSTATTVERKKLVCGTCKKHVSLPKSWNSPLCRACKEALHQVRLNHSHVGKASKAQEPGSIWTASDVNGRALQGGLPGLGKKS